MSDYSIKELEQWSEKIEKKARELGLDFYDQEFEIVSYEEMIGYEAYTGMPSHYPHWSYGKAYEKLRTLNKYNLSGLPYEMVINSDPCIAYLMKDNTLLLQILTIAHVFGHNDFFRNNRLFRDGTRAKYTLETFKNHAGRIREYISDPSIGYSKVERILDAAHALKLQTSRVIGEKKHTLDERKKQLKEVQEQRLEEYPAIMGRRWKEDESKLDFSRIPLEPEDDILLFISSYGKLEEWEKDIIGIVQEETAYFIPQIETKIMNEGWASFWHYTILNSLELPQGLHMEFLKRHNQVVRPHQGSINPYYAGFKIFNDLYEKNGRKTDLLFDIRELERDQSFIRRYLTQELCEEMNLFEFVKKDRDFVITEVSDEEGWKSIRETLALSAGMGSVPVIRVKELVKKDNTLMLEHVFDGRELELIYAAETLKYAADLWGGKVVLSTQLDGHTRQLVSQS